MITRSQLGIVKPIDRLSLHTYSISPIPKNPSHALKDPNWHNAMYYEYNVLVKNGTWLLIPRPTGVNMVRSMWLFKNKFHADGTLSRYKARLVAIGSSQQLAAVQKKYDLQLLERAHMVTCNPSRTRVDTESKLVSKVQQICLYMYDPREPHLAALKRILQYVQGTLYLGLHIYASSTTSLVGYTDADWVGCPSTRRSTSGYCVFLGDNLLSWSAKRQYTLLRSSAKAEYQGVANVVAETTWLPNCLRKFNSV
ncbi:ribonuclease H-like domain-containing protein [Tanacetum coccineum]